MSVIFLQKKKKGPGRGWWGPPRGTHVPSEGGEGAAGTGAGGQTLGDLTGDTEAERQRWDAAKNNDNGTRTEAQRWGDDNLTEDYNDAQVFGIEHYTGDAYTDINGTLRGAEQLPSGELETAAEDWAKSVKGATDEDWQGWSNEYMDDFQDTVINGLDNAISSNKAPVDVVVYRGISRNRGSSLIVGDKFTDSAYVSAALRAEVTMTFGPHLLQIRVKKGTNMAWTDGFSQNPSELEVIFGRDTEFTIIETGPGGSIVEITG